jgi:hypothetical protein
MEVIVKYLSRDKQLVVVEREVIKLVDGPDATEITPIDHGVLEMKTAIRKLESQVDDIQRRIERCVSLSKFSGCSEYLTDLPTKSGRTYVRSPRERPLPFHYYGRRKRWRRTFCRSV